MADQGNINTPDAGELDADAIRYCTSRGWAMDDGSYPIRDVAHHGVADLERAVHAVGRGSGSHDAIRRHIIARAKALHETALIPDNWDSDGSLSRRSADDYDADTLFRSFTPDLEVRSSAQGGDGRTIVGIAVPYGTPQWIGPGLTEQFRRGAFNAQLRAAHRIPFARDHMALGGRAIGRAAVLRDDAAGLYGEWRISRTPLGDETLELVRDGVLSNLSIGFRARNNTTLARGVTERVTAELREVAVVMEGAYGDAALVSAVRAAGLPYAGVRQPHVRNNADEASRYLAEMGLG